MSTSRGFTLLETMVALTVLAMAIAAPITLVAQSLMAADYARDQITAFYLAQEAIEGVRAMRDNNILQNALTGSSLDIMQGIPDTAGNPFRIDVVHNNTMTMCSGDPGGQCIPLQVDSNGLYGYYSSGGTNTSFTRSVTATFINGNHDEVQIAVTVTWQTGSFQARSFKLSEDLYRWVVDGSGSST